MRRIVTVLFVCVPLMAFEWAYINADSAAFNAAWRSSIPRVGIYPGVRGTIGPDSAVWHKHFRFTSSELARVEAICDSLGVAVGDSTGFVVADP